MKLILITTVYKDNNISVDIMALITMDASVSVNAVEHTFKMQLNQMYATKKSLLLSKEEYYAMIEELKEAPSAKQKSRRQYYLLER